MRRAARLDSNFVAARELFVPRSRLESKSWRGSGYHSGRFNAADDSTKMTGERNRHQREQRHCEISNTRREAFGAEARAHPAEKKDEQRGSQRADHMQP